MTDNVEMDEIKLSVPRALKEAFARTRNIDRRFHGTSDNEASVNMVVAYMIARLGVAATRDILNYEQKLHGWFEDEPH